MTRDCPPPNPAPHGPVCFAVPAGSVDTHAHVIGAPPYSAARSYTAPVAEPADYLAMLEATGMAFGVLVQVSVHGTDNRLLLETLNQNRARLRGIAVVAPDIDDDASVVMRAAGIVGLRLNTLYGGGIGFAAVDRYEALCAEHGWHLQFLADANALAPLAPRLSRLRVPYVIDHMGHIDLAAPDAGDAAALIRDLVADGAWVKLSGAYRLAAAPPYSPTIPLARSLIEAAPDRCLWGSDWPHVANWNAMPNVGDLLDLLAEWAPDPATRHRILVENPQRLYGFAAP